WWGGRGGGGRREPPPPPSPGRLEAALRDRRARGGMDAQPRAGGDARHRLAALGGAVEAGVSELPDEHRADLAAGHEERKALAAQRAGVLDLDLELTPPGLAREGRLAANRRERGRPVELRGDLRALGLGRGRQ